MSAALANDGAGSFVVLLVVLLAMMLVAVIRLPEWAGSSQEDARPQPATAAPMDALARAAAMMARAEVMPPARRAPGPQPGDTAPMPVLAVAASQPGQPGYAGRHAAGPVPGEGTIRRLTVSSGPPWGPAPKPSGIR